MHSFKLDLHFFFPPVVRARLGGSTELFISCVVIVPRLLVMALEAVAKAAFAIDAIAKLRRPPERKTARDHKPVSHRSVLLPA